MIEKLNAKIRPLLEFHEEFKDVLTLAKIKTPKIATCGMQSHGKSSTLQSITKIELPSKSGTCTICPIKICLRETKQKEYFQIKLEGEDPNEIIDENFNNIKDKINKKQEEVKQKFNIKDKKITKDTFIQVNVYKKKVPNLDLYDLPGLTHVEGIENEAIEIYNYFLKKDKDTTVLLILNGGDDLTNSSVTKWMKEADNYQNRFIPVIAKADQIKKFEDRFKELKNFGLKTKPFLIINKDKDDNNLKDLNEENEIDKIKKIIPDVEKFNVNIGIKKLIDELIKIQYEKYDENYKDLIKNMDDEIKKNEEKLEKLPPDYLEKDFDDNFEDLLKKFIENIIDIKKRPNLNDKKKSY